MVRRNVLGLVLLSAAVIATGLCSYSPAQNRPLSPSPKMRALLEQKRDTLRTRLDMYAAAFRNGTAPAEAVNAAQNDLLDAELALATDKAERVTVLEKKLTNAKEYENLIKERYRVGARDVKQADALMATAQRLDAEIALLREQESN